MMAQCLQKVKVSNQCAEKPKNKVTFCPATTHILNVVNHKNKNLIRILTLSILLTLNFIALGQDKMIVDKQTNTLSSFIGYSEYITNLDKVPKNIKSNLKEYLKLVLGEMCKKVKFVDGYISDLDGYFKENPQTYNRGWIATKYQFIYSLSYNEIGIKNYFIKIDIDNFGQILNSNWPKEHYNDSSYFKNRSIVLNEAIKWAKRNNIFSDEFETDLKYHKKLDKLCWVFKFAISQMENRKTFSIVEIDWKDNSVIDEYTEVSTTVY